VNGLPQSPSTIGFSLCCGCVFSAGELSAAELENLMVIVANPRQFKIPDWFLNRQKDHKDGRFSQVVSNTMEAKMREDLERLKKIRYCPCYCYCSCRCHCHCPCHCNCHCHRTVP